MGLFACEMLTKITLFSTPALLELFEVVRNFFKILCSCAKASVAQFH